MTFQEFLKKHKTCLLLFVLLLVGNYHQIVLDMVKDWYNDENYSHGFLVPLISAYFFWQSWPKLKEQLIKPDVVGIVVVVFALLQLMLGWVATEYFTMRSSLIVLLIGLSLCLFGREIVKGMALALGYLIFMVPLPYIIYDMVAFPLKLFVTKASVLILKLVGVTVLREGNILMFPSTTLEVADACSGIRSLISLLALAVAYAFFMQTSNFRRWIIIASAVPIAIASNSMRVIVTGVLAQWWGERAAQGFFHEFAGLAVFALAMVMLVVVGALVKGRDSVSISGGHISGTGSECLNEVNKIPVTGFTYRAPKLWLLITALMMVSTALFVNLHTTAAVPTNRPFSQFPLQIRSWSMSSEAIFSDAVLSVLKPTDYISRQYRDADGKPVGLYIGYHNGAKGTGGIHSPKNCLPGSGWYEISTGIFPVVLNGKPENVVRAIYQKGEAKELFIYWFQMKGKVLSNEYALKIKEIINSFIYGRKDETFIRISIPFDEDSGKAIARGEKFISDFYPVINEFLPR